MKRSEEVVSGLAALVGNKNVKTGIDAEGYLEDFWGRAKGQTICVVLPATTHEVSAVLAYCYSNGLSVFPQGGNTSTCLGAVPDSGGNSVVVALSRMNQVISINPVDGSLIAEAGCVLADIQQAAASVDRFFPLSLGAEGSCQIGGNVATNAGGTSVLRYGNTRDLVLGLEVVLPDGRVWDGLRTLRKNNTGYDLKHLFIGAEGSLGIITKVAIKIFPSLPNLTCALVSFRHISDLPSITEPLRAVFDTSLIAMELISGSELRIVRQIFPDMPFPFEQVGGWYLLIDIASDDVKQVNEKLEAVLEKPLSSGLIDDVVVSVNEAQRVVMWRLRHNVTESHKKYGVGMSHDVAVPLSRIPDFLLEAGKVVEMRFPEAEIAVVGHVGDGNLHYNVMFEMSRWNKIVDKPAKKQEVYNAIYDIAAAMDGTFSAEHGIGALHLAEMSTYKSQIELDMMRGIKTLFDATNMMNPGRVIPR